MVQIFPSLIAANLLNLEKEIQRLEPHVDGYHIDVMDFHFVPNLTLGPDFVNAIRAATKKPLMVHLMVDYPERYFKRMALKEDDIVSIHPESPSENTPTELIQAIADLGWTPSLALNPDTNISVVQTIDAPLKHILLMSVNPGFSGQEFMPLVYEKIKEAQHLDAIIAVDGGVNLDNARKLADTGAHQLVLGSALFKDSDPVKALSAIQKTLR